MQKMFSDKERTLQETQVSVAKKLGEAEHKAATLQAGMYQVIKGETPMFLLNSLLESNLLTSKSLSWQVHFTKSRTFVGDDERRTLQLAQTPKLNKKERERH